MRCFEVARSCNGQGCGRLESFFKVYLRIREDERLGTIVLRIWMVWFEVKARLQREGMVGNILKIKSEFRDGRSREVASVDDFRGPSG